VKRSPGCGAAGGDTISVMADFRDMARDPKHRRRFEKLLYLAAQRGDADLVAERLSWGIDPNCTFAKGRTPLIANVRGFQPQRGDGPSLLAAGADPAVSDESGQTALDYARRSWPGCRPGRPAARAGRRHWTRTTNCASAPRNRMHSTRMRRALGGDDDARDYLRLWWQERLRAARAGVQRPGAGGEDYGAAGSGRRAEMTADVRFN